MDGVDVVEVKVLKVPFSVEDKYLLHRSELIVTAVKGKQLVRLDFTF